MRYAAGAAHGALWPATVSLAGYVGSNRNVASPQEAIVYASMTVTFALNLAGLSDPFPVALT